MLIFITFYVHKRLVPSIFYVINCVLHALENIYPIIFNCPGPWKLLSCTDNKLTLKLPYILELIEPRHRDEEVQKYL